MSLFGGKFVASISGLICIENPFLAFQPYMYLKKFRVNETMLRPMKIILDGNYSFFSTWMTHKVKRMKIDLYFTWES